MVKRTQKQRTNIPEIGQMIAGIIIALILFVGLCDFFFRDLPSTLLK